MVCNEHPRDIPYFWGVPDPDNPQWGPIVLDFLNAYRHAQYEADKATEPGNK